MRIEEYIESAMVNIMSARSFISSNAIPVVRFRDRLTAKGDKFITVHAMPNTRLSNNHNLYFVELELLSDTKVQEDIKAAALDDLISECNDEINETMTAATLQAAIDLSNTGSGITIAGHEPISGSESDNDYQIIRSATKIALIYN